MTEPMPLIESIEEACEILCPHGAQALLMNCKELPRFEISDTDTREVHGKTFTKVDVTDVANTDDERDVGFTIIVDEGEDHDAQILCAQRSFTAAFN